MAPLQYPCRSSEPLCESARSDLEHSVRCLTQAVKGLQQQDLSRRSDLLPKLLIEAHAELNKLSADCKPTSMDAGSGVSTCVPTLESLSTQATLPCFSGEVNTINNNSTWEMSPTPEFGSMPASPPSGLPVDDATHRTPLSSGVLCASISLLRDPPSKSSRRHSRLAEKPSPQCPMFSMKGLNVAEPVQKEDATSDPYKSSRHHARLSLGEKISPQCPRFSTKGFTAAKPVQNQDATSDPWELQFLSLAQSS